MSQYTDELIQKAVTLYSQEVSVTEVARKLGLPRSTVWCWIHQKDPTPCPGEPETEEDDPDTTNQSVESPDQYVKVDSRASGQVITANTSTIRTVEELLVECQIDLDVWEVERSVVKKCDGLAKTTCEKVRDQPPKWRKDVTVIPLYHIAIWLRRRKPAIGQILMDLKQELLDAVAHHAPVYPVYQPPQTGERRYLLEIGLPDLHYGKLAWSEETGEDYDGDIAERRFRETLDVLLARAIPYGPEQILFVLGNDFLHIDNLDNTTTRGTRQDVDTRPAKIFRRGWQLLVEGLDKAASVAPVDAVIMPGNHDTQSMAHVGEVLVAWYRNTDRVMIDNSPRSRKYYDWGRNLIGLCHCGKDDPKPDKLPLLMPVEAKEAFARTDFHSWHVGHWHTPRETKYNLGDTYNGISVRVLASLSGTDAWHYTNGFVGQPKAGEAFLHDYEQGCVAHFIARAGYK